MRIKLFTFLLPALLFGSFISAQDFSNKGKEFWLAYCYHVGMVNAGGQPTMTLYITSDVNTKYTVEIYGGSIVQTGNIAAGQVITVIVPNTVFINNEGLFSNKAIRVTADNPVVVYSYITRSAASGATLALPTNVLGKEYYAISFTQASNEANSNSYFTIIAVEDNTTVQITPSANTKNGWLAGQTYTVNLNKGDIYQVLGTVSGTDGADLSGSKIKSVASGVGGCKRIAVFSGSGKIRIPATCTAQNSADNLYQQLYPIVSWGKKFLTVPSYNRPYNYYRILISDPTTNVFLNGSQISAASFTNNYYEFSNTTPNSIEADKPISVTQYFTTQGCDGNAAPYDPDMIVLNPVEQNIDKVTLVSSNLVNSGAQHHIHVIMHNGGTGISSFTVDGAPPAGAWVTHSADPNYSYIYLGNVSQGYHRLSSDSGFNAIAYGYADAESYGYSAGANVKDLYQFVSVQNQYATVNFPAACKNSPFFFSMTFPYQPTQIQWEFGGLFTDTTINAPVYDSTWIVNSKQLYRYKLPNPYFISATGTYPIKVIAQNPTADGCSGEQEIDYDLQVFDAPLPDFTITSSGCLSDSIRFADKTNTNGRTITHWSWNFGDNGTSLIKSPSHLYSAAGLFTIKYSNINDIGCISDTVSKTLIMNAPPIAKFGVLTPNCVGKAIRFVDSSSAPNGTLVKWYWNFGDGSPEVTANTNATQTHSYASAGSYSVTLKVELSGGCQSLIFNKSIIVHTNPVASFTFGNACLPAGSMQFTDASTISDGTQSQFSYQWSFGDGGNSTQQNPVHNFNSTGPFTTTLEVTSNNGCVDDTTRIITTVYAQPQADFSAPAEICFGAIANFTDKSTATNSVISNWQWDFGDGSISTQQNPSHNYTNPGSYTVQLISVSAVGCASTVATKTITINALPVSDFTVSSPTCATKDISFTDASVSSSGTIVKWIWDLGDGSTFTKNSNSLFTHSYLLSGTYNATLKTETDKGCVGNLLSKTIIVNPLPNPGFIVPDNCVNDPFVKFIDTSSIADGSQFTYQWSFGDANSNAGNPNISTAQNPQHKFTSAGNYTVGLTVTSAAGCSDAVSHIFTINGAVPQSIFTVNGGTEHCSNEAVSITDNSSVDFGKVVKLDIYWDYINDPTNKTIISHPISGGIYSYTYPEFYSPSAKTYQIKVIAYSGENCLNASSQNITLKATPQLQFNPLNSICQSVPPFQITTANVINGLHGTTVFSGKGVSSSGVLTPMNIQPGLDTIRYTFTAANGCINYKEQTISVLSVPTVNAGPDRFILQGGNGVLFGSGKGNNITYAWTPITGLNNPSIPQPIVTPADDITYTLTVTSSDGCSDSDQVFVQVLKTPTIPNTFSPNGDGVHDKWEIQYLESYPGCTIDIYNRYGQLVFHSVGYSNAWDGTVNGKPLPAGTYYYIIDPKNGRKQLSGFVDIIR